jgi:glycerate kinase
LSQRVLVAPDKFKGTLTAGQAADALARGFGEATALPLADGGEGTLDVLVAAARRRGERVEVRTHRVSGPLGAPVDAAFAFFPAEGRALLESARTSGLGLLHPEGRDALRATSRGLGELALAAIDAGARELWIALGGSATTDGGAGFARAFGARFQDENEDELHEGGGALDRLDAVDLSAVNLRGARFLALTDVLNPLLGERGAAPVFAPQKGADEAAVKKLERGLARLAYLTDPALTTRAGAGAAGGLGFGLAAFAKAELAPGAPRIATELGLEAALGSASLVVTGEGRLDRSTLEGKVVRHVLSRARTRGVRSAVVAGSADPETVKRLLDLGVWRIVTLEAFAQGDRDLARREAARLCEEAARSLAREVAVAGGAGPA